MPKTTEEIERAREQGVPKKTQQDTQYCNGHFEEWRKYRTNSTQVDLPPLTGMTTQMLANKIYFGSQKEGWFRVPTKLVTPHLCWN